MKEKKTSEAQLKASKNWDVKNKEKKNNIVRKSMCKNYILKFADESGLEQVQEWINERKKLFKKC